jgi:2-aminoadipate transaminase
MKGKVTLMADDLTRLCARVVREGPAFPTPTPPATVRYNLDAGYPAPEILPSKLLGELAGEVLDDPAALGYVSLRYDPDTGETIYWAADFVGRAEMTLGNTELRRLIAGWLAQRQGISGLESSSLILTSGAAQAISLASSAFIDPGDGALVESLTFAYAFRSLQMRGADVRMVALDEHGLVIESLIERLEEFRRDGVRPKLLYTIPTYQLPTGTVMPLERRRRLLEVADEWDLMIVEDAVYSELHYDGDPPPPTLLSLDTSGRVIQAHAFSKIIATGLRLGWMCGRPELIDALGVVREDLGVSQWTSRIIAEFMRRGELDDQIARAAAVYREKRDIAVATLRETCGDLVSFTPPGGGIFMWIGLDASVDWPAAKRQAALNGVSVREANAFSFVRDTGPVRSFRIGFAHASHEELRTGVQLLGEAISAATRNAVGGNSSDGDDSHARNGCSASPAVGQPSATRTSPERASVRINRRSADSATFV